MKTMKDCKHPYTKTFQDRIVRKDKLGYTYYVIYRTTTTCEKCGVILEIKSE